MSLGIFLLLVVLNAPILVLVLWAFRKHGRSEKVVWEAFERDLGLQVEDLWWSSYEAKGELDGRLFEIGPAWVGKSKSAHRIREMRLQGRWAQPLNIQPEKSGLLGFLSEPGSDDAQVGDQPLDEALLVGEREAEALRQFSSATRQSLLKLVKHGGKVEGQRVLLPAGSAVDASALHAQCALMLEVVKALESEDEAKPKS